MTSRWQEACTLQEEADGTRRQSLAIHVDPRTLQEVADGVGGAKLAQAGCERTHRLRGDPRQGGRVEGERTEQVVRQRVVGG